MDVSVTWNTTEESLFALQKEWMELWESVPDATMYQLPCWQLNWWLAFRPGRLFILEMRSGERLVGLLPLYADILHVLHPLGGKEADIDALLLSDKNLIGVVSAALEMLKPVLPKLSLEFLFALESSLALMIPAPEKWLDARLITDTCPFLTLPAEAKSLSEFVPPTMIRNLRHNNSRAERVGGLTFEHATLETIDAQLTLLFDLHTARWKGKGKPGSLHDPRVQTFLRATAPEFYKLGILTLFVCRLGGRLASAYLGFIVKDTAYYYISGFAPQEAHASPATLTIAHAIEIAMARGVRIFSFLRGEEDYKYKWGAVDSPMYRRRIIM